MNTRRLLSTTVFAAALTASMASMAATETFLNGDSIYGQPAKAAVTARQIDVSSARMVNVAYGETVQFRDASGRQFAWTFDGLGKRQVPVAKIAPAGFAAQDAKVFVGKSPANRR